MKRTITALALTAAAATPAVTACTPAQSPPAYTIALTATSADPEAAIVPLRQEVIERAIQSLRPGDGKVSIVVQGRPGVSAQVDLTPMRGDEVEADPSKAARQATNSLSSLEEQVTKATASTEGQDVLGVMDNAVQVTPDGGTIAVISSGLSTVDPVDLLQAGDWQFDPEGFANGIDQRHLPDASGRHLIFLGLGYPDPTSAQPTPGPAARKAVVRLWLTICHRTGAASCRALDGPAGTAPSPASNTVPVVDFDRVTTSCVGTTTINGDVAFEPDSSVLAPAADQILAPIAQALRNCPAGRVINAIGHAAEVPGGGTGQKLSEERAQAVLQRLQALGAPASTIGTAIGVGNTRDQIVDNTPNGVYDATLARLNRVVELVIVTTTTK